MRAEGNAPTAVDANEGFTRGIEIDGAHGAGAAALFAADAEVLAYEHASSLPLRVGARRAGFHAGGGIAGQAGPRLESGGQAA